MLRKGGGVDAEGFEEEVPFVGVFLRGGLGRRPVVEDDATGLEDENALAESKRLVDVMGHEYNGGLVFGDKPPHQGMHAKSGQGVERTERLVGKE